MTISLTIENVIRSKYRDGTEAVIDLNEVPDHESTVNEALKGWLHVIIQRASASTKEENLTEADKLKREQARVKKIQDEGYTKGSSGLPLEVKVARELGRKALRKLKAEVGTIKLVATMDSVDEVASWVSNQAGGGEEIYGRFTKIVADEVRARTKSTKAMDSLI
jgi:hypothetical protein